MTEDVMLQITRCIDTSNKLWTSLPTMFSVQHRGNSIQIRTQLSTMKKVEMIASAYYHKMTNLVDTMANIVHTMTYEEFIGYILIGLGPGHGDLYTAITVLKNQQAVTLPKIYSYLITHEAQVLAVNSATTDFVSSANNATRKDANRSRRNFSQNQNGYINNNNYRNNYRNRSRGCGRGRCRGRNNGGCDPQCQVCGIPGHVALNCRNHFNHAYQPEEL